MNTPEIEQILRHAPRPAPPAGLKEKLVAEARIVPTRHREPSPLPASGLGGRLARWWPALAPAAVSLVCAAVITVQQTEIGRLQHFNQPPSQSGFAALLPSGPSVAETPGPLAPAVSEEEEINRLKKLVAELTTEVSRLEQMQSENASLRAQVARSSAGVFSSGELEAMDNARQKAFSIVCVNNLKQLGLAVHIWAADNADQNPPRLQDMAHEMITPKVLICPADTGHQEAANWASFSLANCSYEYLAPSAPTADASRVVFRCPIHGNICLADGSVQRSVAKDHPEWLVSRAGKLYLKSTP